MTAKPGALERATEMNTHFSEVQVAQKFIKECSALLPLGKTALRFQLTLERMAAVQKSHSNNAGEALEGERSLCTADGNVNTMDIGRRFFTKKT